VSDAPTLAVRFLAQVDAMAQVARELARSPQRHEQLKRRFAEIYIDELRRMGSTLPEQNIRSALDMDIELNAQGLGVWIDKARGND